MGFEVPQSVFRLRFTDPALAECQVRVRAMSVGELMELTDQVPDLRLDGSMSSSMALNIELLMEWFSNYLADWNLTKNGEPVKTTLDGVKTLELPFVVRMILAWLPATAGVSPDLKDDSPSGEPFPELSIPTEPLSPNPES